MIVYRNSNIQFMVLYLLSGQSYLWIITDLCLISFPFWITLVETFKALLNTRGKHRHTCLIPELNVKQSNDKFFNVMCLFITTVFLKLSFFLFLVLEFLSKHKCWILLNDFFLIYGNISPRHNEQRESH